MPITQTQMGRFGSLQLAFDTIDSRIHADGKVAMVEFEDCLVHVWEFCDRTHATRLFSQLDRARNGTISREEFITGLTKAGIAHPGAAPKEHLVSVLMTAF